MEKFLSNLKIKKAITYVTLGISILLSILFIFLGSSFGPLYKIFSNVTDTLHVITSLIILVGAIISIIISIKVILLQFKNQKTYIFLLTNVIITLLLMLLSINATFIKNAFIIFIFIIDVLIFIFNLIFEIKNKEDNVEDDKQKNNGILISVMLLVASLILLFSIFLIPVCVYNDTPYFSLINALGTNPTLECLISFVAFFILYVLLLVIFTKTLAYSNNYQNKFYNKARVLLYLEFGLTIIFYIFSIVISYLDKSSQGVEVTSLSSKAFIPFILLGIIIVIFSIISSKYQTFDIKKSKNKLVNRIIPLIFNILFLGILVGAIFSKILKIEYTSLDVTGTITINGSTILKNYTTLGSTYQKIAFLIYSVLILIIISFVVSLSLFFRKSNYFYKFTLCSICISYFLILTIFLFSKYYKYSEGIQTETIQQILNQKGLTISLDYTSKISSWSIYFASAATLLLIILILIKPFSNKAHDQEALDVNITNDLNGLENGNMSSNANNNFANNFDQCPAFSEIDKLENKYALDLKRRKETTFLNPTLPTIVRFIVEYAKESRLHLSYKEEDIAQFIAGLASSRLSILQGMSGTGKTSLPKIFSEAIFGNVDIIEVESSWKDKNELIGYYNEFSNKFTPKKFTQALYRAKFMKDAITFIVLDEMNLSRIEYYFSDFLSLMEDEEDKRQIKLLNVQIQNTVNGEKIPYKMLENGHTIKIPTNVWFIGTANRDESTFEISDKVYDRAMTMNFTKRAPKINAFNEPIAQRFLSYDDFNALILNAKNNFKFDCSSNETIKNVEKIVAPFNISFGNRIEKQIESFVSVYCSCFVEPEKMIDEAVEKILLTKVVQKLEFKSIENKEELVHSFESLGLLRCAEFVSKLNEDI